jgi:hypothetical protein
MKNNFNRRLPGRGMTAALPILLKAGASRPKAGFTDQRHSAQAGTAGFRAWLWGTPFIGLLSALLPHHQPRSNNNISPRTNFLALLQGLLCGRQRVVHAGYRGTTRCTRSCSAPIV